MRPSHGAALCTAVFALAASAQTTPPPRLDLERMDVDSSALGSLVVPTGKTLQAGEFRFGLGPLYERKPLVLAFDGQDISTIVRNRLSTQLFGAFGLTSALELGLEVPLISYQRGENLDALGLSRPATAGLGTPRLSGRLHVLDEGTSGLDLAPGLGIGVPIGSQDALGGDGSPSVLPELSAGRQLGDLRASAQLSVLLRRRQQVGGQRFGSHFGADGSIAYTAARFRPELVLRAFVPLTQTATGFEILGGARYAISHRLEAFVLAGPGFGQLIGVPSFQAMAGIAFGTVSLPEPAKRDVPQYAVSPPPQRDQQRTPEDEQRRPPPDRDGDGVPDALDNCPDQPGPASNQGCPYPGEKQLVMITPEQLVIQDKIYFDTAKATIENRSHSLLRQLARVINNHPSIPLVRIEGHTDDRGSAQYNLKLSQARAESVRKFLILEGVEPGRLEAKGYGLERPLESNATPSGRAKNRRVELNIVNLDATSEKKR